jgi:hypothetical protein
MLYMRDFGDTDATAPAAVHYVDRAPAPAEAATEIGADQPPAGRLRALPRSISRWSLVGVGMAFFALLMVGCGALMALMARN